MPVTLWAARLERILTPRETETLLSLLPPERLARLLAMKREEKRQEALCAYALVFFALRRELGWNSLPPIEKEERGKPFFPQYPMVQFNLSHTRGAVLAGISDQAIGVDIERIRPVRADVMARLERADTPEAFFKSWVRREARAKRSGVGVGAALRKECFAETEDFYYELSLFPGYAAGFAAKRPEPDFAVHICSLDELV